MEKKNFSIKVWKAIRSSKNWSNLIYGKRDLTISAQRFAQKIQRISYIDNHYDTYNLQQGQEILIEAMLIEAILIEAITCHFVYINFISMLT